MRGKVIEVIYIKVSIRVILHAGQVYIIEGDITIWCRSCFEYTQR